MKKITIGLAVVALLLLVGEGYYFFTTLTKPEPVVTTAQPVKEKIPQIILFKESGDVSYKRSTDPSYQALTLTSVEIPNLTSVKTATGSATVLLPDNSVISLSNNTEISINYTPQSTTIFQSLGNTYHRVEALISGKTYEVQTPGTLAAVRGTKFAVSYDKIKAVTKVAVTEHSVSVARVKKSFEVNATTTTPEMKLEEVSVSEGDTVKVSEAQATTTPPKGTKPVPPTPTLLVSKIEEDTEVKTWVEENKAKDPIIEKLKTDTPDKKEYRKELENILQKEAETSLQSQDKPTDTTQPAPTTIKPLVVDPNKVVAPKTTDVTKTVITTKIVASTTPIVPVIKKIDEETFFDKFNTIFVKNFYVENDDSICSLTTTTSARVKEVSDYATTSGYPFPAGTTESLTKFSDDIIYYCKNGKGDARVRTTLQTRFDDEFPFKQSL